MPRTLQAAYTVGPVFVYGSWDDVTNYQFAVIWGESGDTVTVLCFSGYDYGGGVSSSSDKVPLKDLEELLDSGKHIANIKRDVESLVKLSNERS